MRLRIEQSILADPLTRWASSLGELVESVTATDRVFVIAEAADVPYQPLQSSLRGTSNRARHAIVGVELIDSVDELDPAIDHIHPGDLVAQRLHRNAPKRVLIVGERVLLAGPRRFDSDPPGVRRWRVMRAQPPGMFARAHPAGTLLFHQADIRPIYVVPKHHGTTVEELIA